MEKYEIAKCGEGRYSVWEDLDERESQLVVEENLNGIALKLLQNKRKGNARYRGDFQIGLDLQKRWGEKLKRQRRKND